MSTYTNKLKLEVETPSGVLPNLQFNTNGLLGGWGWETPNLNTNIFSSTSPQRLTLNAVLAVATRGQTEALPIAAGQYAGARFDTLTNSSSGYFVRASFAWYKSDGTANGTTTPTAYLAANAAATQYVGAQLAPANTAFVRLVIDMYSNNSGGTPAISSHVDFTNVMVTKAATALAIGEVRTNLISNNSFETNTTGWSVVVGGTVTRSTTQAWTGSASLKAGGNFTWGTEASFSATAGKNYIASGYVYAANTPTQVRVQIVWTLPSGDVIEQSAAANVTAAWQRISVVGTAPTGVTGAKVRFINPGLAGSDQFYLDGVVVEEGSVLNAYYTGTFSNASYAFVDPFGWQDITDPATNIQIHSEPLGLGTMDVQILSTILDPSISDLLRPGKRIRLSTDYGSGYTPVWTGKIADATVKYLPKLNTNGLKTTAITIEAVDAAATLAGVPSTQGYETFQGIQFLLEGKGVPWNYNADTSHYTGGVQTVVSSNPSASLLDQIAITRDTQRGYAWVDRFGVINVWERGVLPTSPLVTFADTVGATLSYTDINASWSSKDAINTVTVKWLRYNSGTLQTQEITYPLVGGAYTDAASVAKYGPRSAEFTIQGATESAATIATYAQNILTDNANPGRKVNSLTMPVTNTTELQYATTLGLYSMVTVAYADRVNANLRITGVDHDITPEEWTVVYDFGIAGGAASTINTPGSNAGNGNDSITWTNVTFDTNWANYGSGFQTVQYRVDGTRVYLRGLLVRNTSNAAADAQMFALPVGARPLATQIFDVQYAAGSGRLDITSAGKVSMPTVAVTNGTFVSLNGISFTTD